MYGIAIGKQGVIANIIFATVPLIIVLLNYYRKHLLAKLFFTAFLPTIILIMFILFGHWVTFGYVFLALGLIVFMSFDRKLHTFLSLSYILLLSMIGAFLPLDRFMLYSDSIDYTDSFINIVVVIVAGGWGLYQFLKGLRIQTYLVGKQRDALKQQNDALEDALEKSRVKTELLSIVAHDLRGPSIAFRDLTKKLGFLIRKNDPEELLKFAANFEQTGDKLFYDLDNLLKWVISQKNNIEIVPSDINVGEMADSVIKNLSYNAREKGIRIIKEIDGSTIIRSDETILKTVVRNLVQNAIKYSPDDSAVILETNENGKETVISISDSGNGINKEILETLSNRSHPKKVAPNSHGIGLQLCQHLVEILDVDMVFESKDGKGTTVELHIPG